MKQGLCPSLCDLHPLPLAPRVCSRHAHRASCPCERNASRAYLVGSRRTLQSVLGRVHQVWQQRWLASVYAPAHAVLEGRAKRTRRCAQAQRLCRLCCFAAGADTMDDSSGPTEAGLGVGHHRELRGLEGILEASSTLLLHEQRAVRQPDLFMHSTWSLRDDYHSRHRGPSMGSAVPGMRKSRGRKGAQ